MISMKIFMQQQVITLIFFSFPFFFCFVCFFCFLFFLFLFFCFSVTFIFLIFYFKTDWEHVISLGHSYSADRRPEVFDDEHLAGKVGVLEWNGNLKPWVQTY